MSNVVEAPLGCLFACTFNNNNSNKKKKVHVLHAQVLWHKCDSCCIFTVCQASSGATCTIINNMSVGQLPSPQHPRNSGLFPRQWDWGQNCQWRPFKTVTDEGAAKFYWSRKYLSRWLIPCGTGRCWSGSRTVSLGQISIQICHSNQGLFMIQIHLLLLFPGLNLHLVWHLLKHKRGQTTARGSYAVC